MIDKSQMIRVAFFRSRSIGSWLIRKLTNSEWSHVALVMDGMAIEATIPRVRSMFLCAVIAEHYDYEIRWISCPDKIGAWRFASEQIGKPYDYGFLFDWLFRSGHWQNPGQWACSELVAAALMAGGKISGWSAMSRITPQDLFSGSHADQ